MHLYSCSVGNLDLFSLLVIYARTKSQKKKTKYVRAKFSAQLPWNVTYFFCVRFTFVNSNDFAVNTSSQDVATEGSGTDWVRTSDLALMKRPL